MFSLFVLISHKFLIKEITIQDLVYSLHNDNQWGTFEYLLIKVIMKIIDYFEFKLFESTNFKDKELISEIQKRKREIITNFKKQFLFNV